MCSFLTTHLQCEFLEIEAAHCLFFPFGDVSLSPLISQSRGTVVFCQNRTNLALIPDLFTCVSPSLLLRFTCLNNGAVITLPISLITLINAK